MLGCLTLYEVSSGTDSGISFVSMIIISSTSSISSAVVVVVVVVVSLVVVEVVVVFIMILLEMASRLSSQGGRSGVSDTCSLS